jgi:pantoate--beta-alanine ligase
LEIFVRRGFIGVMRIISSVQEMQQSALAMKRGGRRIGLVPTMGFLHEGHLSLVKIAKHHADVVVLTLFVNPTQFGPTEDLSRYPRDFDRDQRLCAEAGVDILFAPENSAMYAPDASVAVIEEKLSRGLCGVSRPVHFRGVVTVVSKLFNICQPDVAVFGEKDAQQVRVIRRLVRDLNFPVEVISGPTIREPDGLAMSSRNVNLSPEERKQALCLRNALSRAEVLYRSGERDAARIHASMAEAVAMEPLAAIDYIEIVDDSTLEPVARTDKPTLVAMAVKFSKTRLIDNIVLKPET